MPWTCPKCHQDQPGTAPPAPAPKCYRTPQCGNKGKGTLCQWAVPAAAAPVVVLTEAQQAAALGYTVRTNTFQHNFPNGHKTNSIYCNAGETRGISPDGSTHAGGRSGWKGFEKNSGGWSYCGSFQPDLHEWPHRPNDRVHTMPHG